MEALWSPFTVIDLGDMLGLISVSIAWIYCVNGNNDIHYAFTECWLYARFWVQRNLEVLTLSQFNNKFGECDIEHIWRML